MKNSRDIHVVFGENSYLTLSTSSLLNPDDSEVIALSGALNEGPVCNLESAEEKLQARANWFGKILPSFFY